ncbi:MAG: DUF3014 domain-containing protein [Burkholderiaceae bacterium]|nr:DUF3014 domain-containing protein [Burkholderiaceae bacterium]
MGIAQRQRVSLWKTPLLVAAIMLALAAGLWWWLARPAAPVAPQSAAQPPQAEASAPPQLAAASEPAPPPPDPSEDAGALPALDESDLVFARWLEEVLGREGMAQLRINGFARNFVATVDNLGRESAPSRLWPVNPAAGQFETESRDGRTVIGADNTLRYTPFVILVESVDPARLVAVYRHAYPLLQQAYESLGYPGRTFHARLLAVIDQLLAAPEPEGEIEVLPVEVRGPRPLTQPWRYLAFADPALEQLSAGQKLMVRMGPVNQRRLAQVLSRLRAALVAPATAEVPAPMPAR